MGFKLGAQEAAGAAADLPLGYVQLAQALCQLVGMQKRFRALK